MSGSAAPGYSAGIGDVDIARMRHRMPRYYGRALAAALIAAFAAFIVISFARGRIDWRITAEYLF